MVTASYEQQLAAYPLKVCVVSGQELGDDAVDAMFGTALMRFCCEKCLAKAKKDPTPFVTKLHAAWQKSHEGEHDHGHEHKEGKGHDEGKSGKEHKGEHGG